MSRRAWKKFFGFILLAAALALIAGVGAARATGAIFTGATSSAREYARTDTPVRERALAPVQVAVDTPTDTPSPTNTPACQVQAASTDVPKNIPDGQSVGVNSTLVISGINTISDVDLVGLNINHNFIHDIRVKLTSPMGTQVVLINQVCGADSNFSNITLDDSAAQAIGSVCPPTPGGRFRPQNALSAFNGQPGGGTWTLNVADVQIFETGVLTAWGLRILSTAPCGVNTPTSTQTPTGTPTNASTNTATSTATSTPTNTHTFTPLPTGTPTNTVTFTPAPTGTATPTDTPIAEALLVCHVTWQGRPAQPSALQQLPVTLTLKSGTTEVNYPAQTTDASGYFTVTVTGMPGGLYDWRVKSAQAGASPPEYNPGWLAVSGTLTLGVQSTEYRVPSANSEVGLLGTRYSVLSTQVEMGLLRSGDCDNNNLITVPDFVILKNAFGKAAGQPGYDNRADITGDQTVGSTDFIQLKNNFGLGGAPPIR